MTRHCSCQLHTTNTWIWLYTLHPAQVTYTDTVQTHGYGCIHYTQHRSHTQTQYKHMDTVVYTTPSTGHIHRHSTNTWIRLYTLHPAQVTYTDTVQTHGYGCIHYTQHRSHTQTQYKHMDMVVYTTPSTGHIHRHSTNTWIWLYTLHPAQVTYTDTVQTHGYGCIHYTQHRSHTQTQYKHMDMVVYTTPSTGHIHRHSTNTWIWLYTLHPAQVTYTDTVQTHGYGCIHYTQHRSHTQTQYKHMDMVVYTTPSTGHIHRHSTNTWIWLYTLHPAQVTYTDTVQTHGYGCIHYTQHRSHTQTQYKHMDMVVYTTPSTGHIHRHSTNTWIWLYTLHPAQVTYTDTVQTHGYGCIHYTQHRSHTQTQYVYWT